MDSSATARSTIVMALLLAAITAAAYVGTLRNDFVSIDDPIYVTANPRVQHGLNIESLGWAFATTRSANWHPLTWLSHALDWALFGKDPAGHHLTSLLLHLANTLLLFGLLTRMTGAAWRSVFVAALFGVHPVHVESVAWVAERKDVLSTLFWLLTMGTYAFYARRPGVARYGVVFVLLALGLMAKPMLVTLPLVLLLLDFWPLRRLKEGFRLQSAILEKLPLFALAAASCAVTFIVQRQGGAMGTVEQYPIGVRAANAIVAYVAYIVKMVWPARLSAIYPHPEASLPVWQTLVSSALLIGVTCLALRLRRRLPYLTVGWLWYLVTLLPVIGLVQVGQQAMADRYTYVPLVGLFVAVAWWIADIAPARRRSLLAVPAVAAVAALAITTNAQVSHWRNGVCLFEQAVASTSGHPMARSLLADALEEAKRPREALRELRIAVARDPGIAGIHDHLGRLLASQNHRKAARREFLRALEIKPSLAAVHNNLAELSYAEGRIREALFHFRKAVRLDPRSSSARYNLGQALERLGEFDAAAEQYQTALRLDPDSAQAHYGVASCLYRKGELGLAESGFGEAIELKPEFAEAHLCLAMLLLRRGESGKAIGHLKTAIRIRPKWAFAHYCLATAHFQNADYEAASRALLAAERLGAEISPDLRKRIEQSLPGK